LAVGRRLAIADELEAQQIPTQTQYGNTQVPGPPSAIRQCCPRLILRVSALVHNDGVSGLRPRGEELILNDRSRIGCWCSHGSLLTYYGGSLAGLQERTGASDCCGRIVVVITQSEVKVKLVVFEW